MIKKFEPDYICFTDGGSKSIADGFSAGLGIVMIETETNKITKFKKTLGNRTNNYAELRAILESLKMISSKNDECSILIISDSKLCCESLTTYVHSWAKGKSAKDKWMASKGEVKNQELIKEIYYNYLQSDMEIKFVHINSHRNPKNPKHVEKVIKKLGDAGLKISKETAVKFIKLNNIADEQASESIA